MQNQPENGILEEFRIDFLDCWKKLPNKGFFLVLFAAWMALFILVGNPTLGYINSPSLIRWMLDAYNPRGNYLDSDDGHGVLVPFIVLALFWWKRKELMALPMDTWWPGLVILGGALFMHLVAFMIQQPKISVIAMFLGIYGLLGLSWGRRWMVASFFPFCLLAFCVPLGSQGEVITTPLRHMVAIIVTGIAHLGLSPDLVREGTQLMDSERAFHYDVAPACSGIRSLVSLLALTTIFGFVSFKTPWKRALMVVVAFPLAVIGNVVRITFTVLVAEVFGHEWGKTVEQNAGFVTFAVAIGAILLLENWLRRDEAGSTGALKEKPA